MGLLNVFISLVGKCLDSVCLLLDVNFLLVHSVVRSLLAAVNFIGSLPALVLDSVVEGANLVLFGVMSVAEVTSELAQGSVGLLGSVLLALEGLLESLKMVGYLSLHVLLRGKEQLWRGLLSLQEGCSISASLLLYVTNTALNFALIAAANVYWAVASVWLTVSSPLQVALELSLTCVTFLHSSLVGTSAFLWSPCKLLLDFLVSLGHMFVCVFTLNIYGLVLALAITMTTTAYLNPELTRQAAGYVDSFPAGRRLHAALRGLMSSGRNAPRRLRGAARHLHRVLLHLHLLERGLSLRTQLSREQRDHRDHGDGRPAEEHRRGPPDGRVGGDGAPGEAGPRPGKDGQALLSLLSEQEERRKCVICQDCAKTVVLLPCRHLCLCRSCTGILLRQPVLQQNCPLCRHMILNTMEVYL